MQSDKLVPLVFVALAAAILGWESMAAQQPGARDGQSGDDLELATTVADGFTIASVGDVIIAYPQSQNAAPAFQNVVRLIRDADVATGNYEGNIIDGRTFAGSGPGGFAGTPDVAADLKTMGFDLVARSNNHAGEYGYEGLLETNRHLDEAGVVYAGSGEKYASAIAPRFVSTPKGRIGMVATAASFPRNMRAEPGRGEWPGRGGASALRTTRYFMAPTALWPAVHTIRAAFPSGLGFYRPGNESESEIGILGQRFRKAPDATEPYFTFDVNQRDMSDLVASVREGKLKSDFMTVAIHSHHFRDAKGGERGVGVPETDDLDVNPSVAGYLPVFARASIDAGADAFLGTGVHVLRAIEIYEGRPIFYGLGEFFRQMDVVGLSGLGRGRGGSNSPPFKYESIVPVSTFRGGTLAEIRLHPIELTYDVRMAHRGVPQIASTEAATRILTRLQGLSAPYGTTITIEDNIGIIRP